MSRRGIGSLGKPPKKFRIRAGFLDDGSWFAFESREDARKEDQHRCDRLSRIADCKKRVDYPCGRKSLSRLIRQIAAASTLASKRVMRRHRKRIAGHLWRLVDKSDDVKLFTLLPSTWVFPAGKLHEADAIKLVASLRQALRRRGADKAQGWLFGFIDGEYEPTSDTFRLHMHGLASGDMIGVVKGLADARNFQSVYSSGNPNAVRQPIRRQKIKRTLIRAITYCMKSFWCQRSIFENGEGERMRDRAKRGIQRRQPYAEHLMWLDRWKINDLALLMGISVVQSRFRVRRKCT